VRKAIPLFNQHTSRVTH